MKDRVEAHAALRRHKGTVAVTTVKAIVFFLASVQSLCATLDWTSRARGMVALRQATCSAPRTQIL
eukprot:6734991-Pyramimonas_sp.AAC.1